MKYKLTNRQKLTGNVVLFTLEPNESGRQSFQPGQYVALRFSRHGRPTPARCFSIVNAPDSQGLLQFAVRVKGKFTSAFNQLPIGSQVIVSGPFGDFVYDAEFDRHSVFLAGGIGITPIMSIIRSVLKQKYSNTLALLYSVQTENDAVFVDELQELAQQYPNFKLVFAVSRGEVNRFAQSQSVSGRISQELISKAARDDYENTSFFVCGPTGFLNTMTKYLQQEDTPPLRINTEAFTQAQAAHDSDGVLASGFRASSIYSLVAVAFVAVITAIIMTDISGHTTASAKSVPTASTSQSEDSSSSDDSAASTNSSATTTTTTPTTSSNQTYQQPVSSVS